jgi:predicted ester cyclase
VLLLGSVGLGGCVAADGRVYALAPAVESTLQANKDFILRYFAALNQDKSAATVDTYISDADQVLKDHIAMFEAAFPNYQLTAEEMIAEGDQVFVKTTFTGVHNGDLMGIAPTGKEVEILIALTYRIQDGKIVEHFMLADQLTMLQQLGVIPQ